MEKTEYVKRFPLKPFLRSSNGLSHCAPGRSLVAHRTEARPTNSKISRRTFLKLTTAVPACVSFSFLAASDASETLPADFQSPGNFYVAYKDRSLDEFTETNEGARTISGIKIRPENS